MLSSSTNNFAHAQMLSRMSSLSGRMNIARVNIGFFTGFKKIKQWHISFVLGYLCMILWKISTAISIKHRILETFEIKNKFNSDSLYAFKQWLIMLPWFLFSFTMHFILIKPVLSDHLPYLTIFHCSLGRSHKAGLTRLFLEPDIRWYYIKADRQHFHTKAKYN